MNAPVNIRMIRENRLLELTWKDGPQTILPFRKVRQECPCAMCVDEFTGRRILDPETVPENLDLAEASLAGNYALRVRWSDDHDSGLFTWVHLRRIGEQMSADTPSPVDPPNEATDSA
jgi:DUF971 family protein